MSENTPVTLTVPFDENSPWTVSEANFTFPVDLILNGKLPGGREVHNLLVRVRHEGEEFHVVELQFFWRVTRTNFKLAVIHFVMNLSDNFNYLSSEEPTLGNYLQKELGFLKTVFAV